jgi:hypothetical protein
MPLIDELREAMVDAAVNVDLDTSDPLAFALQEALKLNLACKYGDTNTFFVTSPDIS